MGDKSNSGEISDNATRLEDVEEFEMVRKEPVLYLGTNSQTITASTPGNQVVLAWGKKMTVDPYSWAKIEPHCTK